jgi:hypothetical protein
LPTAGGILGGILGEGADVFGGGIAGAAAGDALGKSLEDKLTGQAGGNGVVGAALSGGIGQGVGGLLGKGIQTVAGKVVSPIADKLGVPALQAQFKGTLDATTAKELSDMGITDARQVSQIAPLVTQGDGALSTGVKSALGESGDNGAAVDVTGIDKLAHNTVAEKGFSSPNTLTTVSRNVNQSINNMVPGSVDKVTNRAGEGTFTYEPGALQHALPENVFAQSQKMDKLAAESYNKAYDKMGNVTNSDELTKGQAYAKVADELQNRAFNTNEGATPLPLSDTSKQAIIDKLAPIKDVNPQVYDHYVNAVQNAQTVPELRPLQASMVNASKAYDSTQRILSKGGGLSGADFARGVVGLASNPVKAAAGVALNHPAADRAAAATLKKLSSVTGKATASKMIPLLTRSAAIGATNLPNDAGSPTASAIPGGGGAPNSDITNAGSSYMQPQAAQSPLAQIYSTLLAQEQAAPTVLGPQFASTLGALAPALQKQQLAVPAITNAEQGFNQAGGAQGPMAGELSKLSGLIPGTAAHTYNAQQSSAAAALAQLLGISPEAAMNLLPQLTQSQGTAAPQMGGLQSIVGSLPQAQPVQ